MKTNVNKTNVSIKFNSIEEYREIEKKLEKMGYVNDGMYGEEFIERYRYVSFSTKFKHFDVFDFTLKVEVVYNSLEEFLKDQVMKVNKFNTWRKRLYRCSIYRNNWNNLSIKNKKLNKISINNHEYHYDI